MQLPAGIVPGMPQRALLGQPYLGPARAAGLRLPGLVPGQIPGMRKLSSNY